MKFSNQLAHRKRTNEKFLRIDERNIIEMEQSDQSRLPENNTNELSADLPEEFQSGMSLTSVSSTENHHSHSDYDSTQHDLTGSFDTATDSRQMNVHQQCPGWVSHSQTNQQMSFVGINSYNPTQQQSIPIIALPQYNSQLPFPDKSGNFPHMLNQTPILQSLQTSQIGNCTGYPSIYVSPAGLMTILLKYDIAVEMTVEKNIRVVNHRHKIVAATNSRGSTNYVYHVAAKIFQDGTKTEADVFGERRARMQVDGILFASGMEVYLLDEKHVIPSHFCYNDMSKDCSVNILFNSNSEFSNDTLTRCEEITKNIRYFYHKNGATTTIINNIRIFQDKFGEVKVFSGPKVIATSPVYGSVHLQTHFIDISVQVNWNVSVQRGCHRLCATYTNFVVSNGDYEAGFNQYREVFSRMHNPTISEFESWLPSLTFLCQGLPQAKKRNFNRGGRERNRAGGDND